MALASAAARVRKGPSRYSNEVWVEPPAAARAAARRVLKVRKDLPPSKRAGTAAGLARARSIARGDLQPAREIADWFARHNDSIVDAKLRGATVKTSKALQAADLWGGGAMRRSAEAAVRRAS